MVEVAGKQATTGIGNAQSAVDKDLQFDLRAGDAKKTEGVALREFRGLLGVDHVVWDRGYKRGFIGLGRQSMKR